MLYSVIEKNGFKRPSTLEVYVFYASFMMLGPAMSIYRHVCKWNKKDRKFG